MFSLLERTYILSRNLKTSLKNDTTFGHYDPHENRTRQNYNSTEYLQLTISKITKEQTHFIANKYHFFNYVLQ